MSILITSTHLIRLCILSIQSSAYDTSGKRFIVLSEYETIDMIEPYETTQIWIWNTGFLSNQIHGESTFQKCDISDIINSRFDEDIMVALNFAHYLAAAGALTGAQFSLFNFFFKLFEFWYH